VILPIACWEVGSTATARIDENTRIEVAQFKPYAENAIKGLPVKRLELDGIALDGESVEVYYKDNNKNLKSIHLNKNRENYFSFDKVEIKEDSSLKKQDKPYIEYKVVEKRIPEYVTFANGADLRLSVEEGYYNVKISIPKDYFKNLKIVSKQTK